MSTPPTNRLDNVKRSSHILTAFTVALLLAGWTIFAWFGLKPFLSPTQPVPQPPVQPVTVVETPTPVNPPPTKTTTVDPKVTYAEAEKKLLHDLQRLELGSRLKPLQARWLELQTRHAAWTQRMKGLRTSDEGRRLASTALARQVKFLEWTVQQLSLSEPDRQLLDLQRSLDAFESPTPKLSEWDQRLTALESQLTTADTTIQHCDAALSQLLANATSPHTQTLQQALDSMSETDRRAVREGASRNAPEESHVRTSFGSQAA
jgi:hypothetical protein